MCRANCFTSAESAFSWASFPSVTSAKPSSAALSTNSRSAGANDAGPPVVEACWAKAAAGWKVAARPSASAGATSLRRDMGLLPIGPLSQPNRGHPERFRAQARSANRLDVELLHQLRVLLD